MCQACLFHRQKRTDLLIVRADDAEGGGNDKEKEIFCEHKHQTRRKHEQGADDQGSLAPEFVRMGGEPERDDRVACQCEREKQTDLRFR